MVDKYTPTIGMEIHVQLKTKTKLFAAVDNDARDAQPNTLISHICVGMPGALPVLNEAAIELSIRAALALGAEPQKHSYFERKHYFYPDLPKGYQISQYEAPIVSGGHVNIEVDGEKKSIRVERAHLEEDAGKNIHPAGADYSLVDLNRAGTPLLEIVSYPDMHSPAEAKAYAREVWLLMKYAGVTDGDLYHGHVRLEANISVSKDPNKLGTKTEVKNLNSFRSVEAAVAYEIDRQIELLGKGGKVVQETLGWDDAKQKTIPQREKEQAHDYRYMPEPDIPPVELGDNYVKKIKKQMPELPPAIRSRLAEVKIEAQVIEDILDRSEILPTILEILDTDAEAARRAAFWFLQSESLSTSSARIIELSRIVGDNQLSSSAAKTVFDEMGASKDGPLKIAQRLKLLQVSDENELDKIIVEVITANPKAVEDVKKGEAKAIGFLVGQVMAASHGQANPAVAQKLIKKQLGV